MPMLRRIVKTQADCSLLQEVGSFVDEVGEGKPVQMYVRPAISDWR